MVKFYKVSFEQELSSILKELNEMFDVSDTAKLKQMFGELSEDKAEKILEDNSKYLPPVRSYKLVGHFAPGVYLNKTHTKGHNGIDMKAPEGTSIYSLGPGKVVKSGVDPKGGNYVVTEHEDGKVRVYYAHMKSINVKDNDIVTSSTVIGTVGETGNARGRGAHLHLEVKRNGSLIDPLKIFNEPVGIVAKAELFYNLIK